MKVRSRFCPRNAFSLVEVTLALGVISFALVGIMALFPVAMKTAADSHFETRALFIAQGLMASLQTDGAERSSPERLLRFDRSGAPVAVNLENPGQWFFSFDEEGSPWQSSSAGTWADGEQGAATYLARVAVYPNPDNLAGNISQVEVTVSAPAAAPLARRTQYIYSTLLQIPTP